MSKNAKLIFSIITALLLLAIVTAGCTLSYTKDDGVGLEFMQMQQRDSTASVYSTTIIGLKIKMISKTNPAPEIQIGYVRDARALVPTREDGSLSNVLIDTGVNPFNKNGVTDTLCTGEVVEQLYESVSEGNE